MKATPVAQSLPMLPNTIACTFGAVRWPSSQLIPSPSRHGQGPNRHSSAPAGRDVMESTVGLGLGLKWPSGIGYHAAQLHEV